MGGSEVVRVDSAAPPDRPKPRLTDRQCEGAQIVVDMLPTGATWKEIAEEIGVDPGTLRDWRANPAFQSEMVKRSRRSLREHIPTGHSALIKNVQKGDNQAIKMLLELTGETASAKLRGLLGAWMEFLAVVGIPEVRQLLARVQASHDSGDTPQYNRPPADEIEEAELVDPHEDDAADEDTRDEWEV